jgi:hypothetical protein
MIGLEKTKAKAGEVSQSARALSLDDMHRLYDHCMDPNQSDAEKRHGLIRYVCLGLSDYLFASIINNPQAAYLMAFLMLLRVEETVNLEFEGIDAIPGESMCLVSVVMGVMNCLMN